MIAPFSQPAHGHATQFTLRVPGAQQVFLIQHSGQQPIYLNRSPSDPTLFSGSYTPVGSGHITLYAVFPEYANGGTGLLQY